MSPSLIIVFSLIGSVKFDLFNNVVGVIDDKDIYLKDIWPSSKEVGQYLQELDNSLYKSIYKDIFKGNEFWRKLIVEKDGQPATIDNPRWQAPEQRKRIRLDGVRRESRLGRWDPGGCGRQHLV